MAGITRLRAVPGFLLSLVLCLSGPLLSPDPLDASTPDTGFSVVLSAPAPSATHLVRARADKTVIFSSGCLAAPEYVSFHRPAESFIRAVTRPSDPPNLVLDCPPLAPRPPPSA